VKLVETRYFKIIKDVYLHLLVFTLIYVEFGYRMVVTGMFSGTARTLILLFATAPLIFFLKRFDPKRTVLFVYITTLIAFNSLRGDAFSDCILLFIPIYIGYLIAGTVKIDELAKAFNNVVFCLALFSLAMYAVALLAPGLIFRLPFLGYRGEGMLRIYDALFSVVTSGSELPRNYGITWEPGAFAVLLSVALCSMLVFEKKRKPIRIIVFIIALITTFSTMGYFTLAGILLAFVFQKGRLNAKSRWKFFLLLAVIVAVVLCLPKDIYELVFSKLEGLFSDDSVDIAETTQARIDAIKYPFAAFMESPIFGIGYEDFAFLNATLCHGVATNTILNWFAAMGLLMGIPCTYYYFKLIFVCGKKMRLYLPGILILIVSLVFPISTESLLRISLIYILIFYGAGNSFAGDRIKTRYVK